MIENALGLIGKNVVIQFAAPDAWIGVMGNVDGTPAPVAEISPQGKKGFIMSPVVYGKVVGDADGFIVLEYVDDDNGWAMQIAVRKEKVLCMSSVARKTEQAQPSLIQTP